jgi:DNA-binding response OmpR family regulator
VLRYLKQDKALSHIPVIMISALDEIESVVRCIEMGAEDFLSKPFDPVLLRARISASLEKKRLRDKEIQYLEQVTILTNAAMAVEDGTFDSSTLDVVAHRADALGNLARIFQHMASEVYQREQKLIQEVQELRIEIDRAKRDRQVSEITESDYFRMLQEKANHLRKSSKQSP